MRIVLEDGKYIYEQDERGSRALRYGEPWRDLTGDKFVWAMASEIERLRTPESWRAKVDKETKRIGRALTLDELLALAKTHNMTPEEIEAQRRSWARQDKD